MKVHLNLTTRLVLIFVLFATVLLGSVGALAYTSGQAGLRQAATSELLTRALEKQAALDNWISVARTDIATQAGSPVAAELAAALLAAAPGSLQAQAAHDRLVREFQPYVGPTHKFTDLFFLEAESGQVLAATDPSEEGKFKENRSYFINGKRTPYVSEMYYSLTLGGPAMTAAAPVVAADGRLLGVLAGHLDLEVLNTLISRRTGLHQTDDAYLLNTTGLLVTQPRFISAPILLQPMLKTEAINRCLGGNSGVISDDDYRGVPAIMSYRWLPERQMCLIVKIDQAEAFAPSLAFGRTIVLTGGLALVSAIVLAIVLARSFTRPLLALQTAAARLGQGDLEYRVAVKSQDEIGRLTAAFNEMAGNLQSSRGETAYGQRLLLALSQAAQAVQRARTPEEVYRIVGDEVARLGYNAVVITLTDDRAHLSVPYMTFKPGLLRAAEKLTGLSAQGYRFPLVPGSFFQRIIAEGETAFSESTAEVIAEAIPGPLRPLAGRLVALLGLEQVINAPLTVGGERHGLLVVFGAGLTEADVPAVTTFANQAAIALENTRAAATLRESEAKYRNLTESLDELIYRADPETFVATYVNRAVERIYGYTVEEFLGDPTLWESTIHPEDKERVFAWFTEPQRKMESGAIEYRIIRKDKTVRWVEDHVSWEKDQQGNVVSLNGVLYDITERKRAEQALKTFATQLERSNRELQDFAYIASHDLQEPLRKIQAFGDRLETRYTGALDEQGRDYLQRMQQAARRMQRLINDLLAYSRVTTGGQPFVAVDLAQVTREVLSDLEVRLEQTGGQVEVGDPSTLRQAQDGAGLPKIQADPTQMQQLLQNLIGNALKFHREGVPPVVKLHAQISEVFETSEVSITVADNGIGFDEKYLDRLFQPFQRLHGRQEYEGSGMGLAICRKIVERHGGSITARSTPGQGTTFIVVLPLKHSEGGT